MISKVDKLGLQLQKFGANVQLMAQQVAKLAQHSAYLVAAVSVLMDRGVLTEEEISAKLQKASQRVSDDSNPSGGS